MSGADLANLVNEAALLAARGDKKRVTMLEVTPPGQQASITSPTASSPLSPNAVASAKPTISSRKGRERILNLNLP